MYDLLSVHCGAFNQSLVVATADALSGTSINIGIVTGFTFSAVCQLTQAERRLQFEKVCSFRGASTLLSVKVFHLICKLAPSKQV